MLFNFKIYPMYIHTFFILKFIFYKLKKLIGLYMIYADAKSTLYSKKLALMFSILSFISYKSLHTN